MPLLRLGELTMPAFAALDPKPTLLVPVGIVEEHGPHLPLDADSIQAQHTCDATAERIGGLVAPLVGYGNCSSTKHFPGSFSLRFDTVRAIATDILGDCERHGLRTVAFVSGHAGGAHMRALKLAAEEFLDDGADMRIYVLADYELLDGFDAKAAAGVDVPRWDGHAGAIETSRVLALRPDLVVGRGKAHQVRFPDHLVERDASRHFPAGVMGDPTLASERLGKAANGWIVDRLVDALSRR
jgi:creatinine amidohydrolase